MVEASSQGATPPVAELTSVLFSEDTLDGVLRMIAAVARSALIPLYGASVSLVRDGSVITSHSAPEEVRDLDERQYSVGTGPCMEAIRTGHPVRVGLAGDPKRWPHLSELAAELAIAEVLALPLLVRGRSIGALNLYIRVGKSLSEREEEAAQGLATQAAVALANAADFMSNQVVNDRLQAAVQTREVIGQAQGILMARENRTRSGAFDLLRVKSQRSNRKLRDVAAELVEETEDAAL